MSYFGLVKGMIGWQGLQSSATQYIVAEGGNATRDGDYIVRTFTAGTFNLVVSSNLGGYSLEWLAGAGGGAGGSTINYTPGGIGVVFTASGDLVTKYGGGGAGNGAGGTLGTGTDGGGNGGNTFGGNATINKGAGGGGCVWDGVTSPKAGGNGSGGTIMVRYKFQ